MRPFMGNPVKHFGLIVTGVSFIMTWSIFTVFFHISAWKPGAQCALVIGILNGLLFSLCFRYSIGHATKAIRLIRNQLQDLVFEKLMFILQATEVEGKDLRSAVEDAIADIDKNLAIIEAESHLNRDL